LIEADRPAWQQMLAKAALIESNRQTMDRVRASLVEQTSQSKWEAVVAAAGPGCCLSTTCVWCFGSAVSRVTTGSMPSLPAEIATLRDGLPAF